MFKKLLFVIAFVLLFSVTPVMAQDYCDADANSDLKVDLSDLVIMKGEFLRTDCAPCGTVASLEARIAQLEALLANVTRGTVQGKDTIRFSGVNVQITNGLGDTYSTNGLGNLIVGYNALRYGGGDDRTGSHNIVVGDGQNYSSYGGLVAGYSNTISGMYASVTGGYENTASGGISSVSGGYHNEASGYGASVSGGGSNTASGEWASVSGGTINVASAARSSVSGGTDNTASATYASVSGGAGNTASYDYASVSGGRLNVANDNSSSVSGGIFNTASGYAASVSGGINRSTTGVYDWAAGALWQDQ